MNIKIAPDKYCIRCTYQEAILYCFTLNIDGKTGWRLPMKDELADLASICWYHDDSFIRSDCTYITVPVRDLT